MMKNVKTLALAATAVAAISGNAFAADRSDIYATDYKWMQFNAMYAVNELPRGDADDGGHDYLEMEFLIGVDSTRNVSGAQEGALSVANNMFWSWNSGYIYIKMEGSSPQANGNSFVYHIGGFKSPHSAIQHSHFDFGSSLLKIKPGASPQVHAFVDISKLFNAEHGGTNLSVGTLPVMTMPGANAKALATNFHHAFKFDHIHN